jgi:glycosyltransferase involved in cell wall biosynthesis
MYATKITPTIQVAVFSTHAAQVIIRKALRSLGATGDDLCVYREGFGIPPVESLKAGVPVITLPQVPSVAILPPLGQIRLADTSAEAVANVVLALEDDRLAGWLWAEAATLDLGT